jgi:hypothetical protein
MKIIIIIIIITVVLWASKKRDGRHDSGMAKSGMHATSSRDGLLKKPDKLDFAHNHYNRKTIRKKLVGL